VEALLAVQAAVHLHLAEQVVDPVAEEVVVLVVMAAVVILTIMSMLMAAMESHMVAVEAEVLLVLTKPLGAMALQDQ